MAFDTIIRGGTVATGAPATFAAIRISDGRLRHSAPDLGDAKEIWMCHGKLVLPGGIDSHVHLSQRRVRHHDGGRLRERDPRGGVRRQHHGLPSPCSRRREPAAGGEGLPRQGDGIAMSMSRSLHHRRRERPSARPGAPALVEDGYTSFKGVHDLQGNGALGHGNVNVMSVARETGAL